MTLLPQYLVNGLAYGGIVAMFALGLATVYSVLGVLNLAYGETVTMCSYSLAIAVGLGLSFWLAVPLGILAAVAISVATEVVACRRLRGASPIAVLFTSFAFAVIVQNLIRQIVGPRPKGVPVPAVFDAVLHIGDLVIPVIALITLATSLLTTVALVAFLQRTRPGVALRAAADDFTTARLLGVRANSVILLAFVLSGTLGGVAGVLWVARLGSATPGMGFSPLLLAFVASVVGGLGTIRGALLGGYAVGIAHTLLAAYLPDGLVGFTDALMMVTVVGFLFIRPHGLVEGVKVRDA